MRKLTKGNKTSFGIFTVVVIFIVVLFVFGIYQMMNSERYEYEVMKNSFVYDETYNLIEVTNDTTLSRKWNGRYYLKSTDHTYQTPLGLETVIYQADEKKLQLYGSIYQVFRNGDVNQLKNRTEVAKTSSPSFYKLSDRRYLMVGGRIKNEAGTFTTAQYLLVVIDKSGNALLVNNEYNIKTIQPIVLTTEDWKFDVANEQLQIGNNSINLKKIKGSSNQYQKPTKTPSETPVPTVTPNQDQGNNQTAANGNQSQNRPNQNIQNNMIDNSFGSTEFPSISLMNRHCNILGVKSGTNYLDFKYSVVDIKNEYQTIFVVVKSAGKEVARVDLNKDKNAYRIRGLQPDQEYELELRNTYMISGASVAKEELADSIVVRTNRSTATLSLERVTKKQLYVNLTLDPDYIIESGEIGLYVDHEKQSSLPIDVAEASKRDGWNFAIDYEAGTEIVIQTENCLYNNQTIKLNLKVKFMQY
jgi:hypothetical protein